MLFIDFPENLIGIIKGKYQDVSFINTIWGGGSDLVVPDKDMDLVFYYPNRNDVSTSVHLGNERHFSELISRGGIVVVFVGSLCKKVHIDNLLGAPEELRIENTGGMPTAVSTNPNSPFVEIFSKYGSRIITDCSLFDLPAGQDYGFGIEGIEVIAVRNDTRTPTSFKRNLGKGFYLFLPDFGATNIDVIDLLVDSLLPVISPGLFIKPENDWLKVDKEYFFPKLLKISEQIQTLDNVYQEKKTKLESEFENLWEKEQKPFNNLLTLQGNDLKLAVMNFFKYIGFCPIDVDKFWEVNDPSREKEEDLWLASRHIRKLESIKSEKDLILVEVKSMKNTASDDDVGAISKYLLRRIKEFKNDGIKGIMVANHSYGIPAKNRKSAFSVAQVKDISNNSSILVSAYEVFKFAKAISEKKITKAAVRKLFQGSTGELVCLN